MEVIRLRTADGANDLDSDDGESAARRAASDPAAFAEVYVMHRDAVFRFLRVRVQDEDAALDLTADTFERALGSISRYSPRGGGIRAWLFRIARNTAVDHARRHRMRIPFWTMDTDVPASEDDEPERSALVAHERRQLRMLLADLPDVQRDAIALRYGAGLTAREIAVVIGKGEEATQKLLSRALRRLKETYRDER
jgi:RNA polymerase sigma-70 factor (ECF subfamily)